MKVTTASYLDAISAYNKAAKSFNTGDILNKDQTESFSNVMNNSVVSHSNFTSNPVTNNSPILWLGETYDKTKEKLRKSEDIGKKVLTKEASLTDMVTALSEAEIALQSVINIRDKVIAAYQDIIKMQI